MPCELREAAFELDGLGVRVAGMAKRELSFKRAEPAAVPWPQIAAARARRGGPGRCRSEAGSSCEFTVGA